MSAADGQRQARGRGGRLARLRDRLGDDRGSLTLVVVLWTPILMLLTAFVVDMGFLISQRDRAADLADQAARRVADDLDKGSLRAANPTYRINVDTNGGCMTDAQGYLASSGVDPGTAVVTSCTVSGASADPLAVTVNVTVQLTYKPLFAGLVMTGPVTVTEKGAAHPATG